MASVSFRPTASTYASRRDFFKALGAGFTFFVSVPAASFAQESGTIRRDPHAQPNELAAWLHVDTANRVTVFTGKVEVGQNARTALTQAVAEELGVDPVSVELIMGDTDRVPWDMGTFGSRTTPTMAPVLRRAAATARTVILEKAAGQWKCDAGRLELKNGVVSDPSTGKTASISDLANGSTLLQTISGAPVHQPNGVSLPKIDGRRFVTGAHLYSSDLRREGMLYGSILRPPRYGAKLLSVDGSAATALGGVQVTRDGEFVGVTGPNSYIVQKAVGLLKTSWSTPAAAPNSENVYDHLKQTAEASARINNDGNVDQAWPAAAHEVKSSYKIAYIAHTPLEPRSALAEWNGHKLTVWTGTQVPFGVRAELAEHFHVPETQVRVVVPDTGSAYGGKHSGECAVEAARLARDTGKPVKVTWSRAEEFMWAYFRPGGVIDVRGAVDAGGRLTAWEFHNYNSGPSGIDTPYTIANKRIGFHECDSPLRQGSYRGLASTANNFARESHMDVLAHIAGVDPLEFRHRHIKDPRLRAVLDAVAERCAWASQAANAGIGLACATEKGSYVATCAEVALSADKKSVNVVRLVTAFECGAIVNPAHLENQVEGAVVMGLGGALFEAIEFDGGCLRNGTLSKYRVPRFSDVPPVMETILIDRKDLPSAGAGETPLITVAPAIRNAIRRATGLLLYSLPMIPHGLPSESRT